MKLSEKTIAVLKNFATINPSIVFRVSDKLYTISPAKTIVGIASIEDEFPVECGILDVARFLQTIGLFDEPELEFQEKYVTITEKRKSVRYVYTNPALIKPAPWPQKPPRLPPMKTSFRLYEKDYLSIRKARDVLGLPDIVIGGDEGKIYLGTTNTHNPTTDELKCEIGEQEQNFTAVFKYENLRLIPGDYDVEVGERASHFVNPMVEYFIAVEASSKFE